VNRDGTATTTTSSIELGRLQQRLMQAVERTATPVMLPEGASNAAV
jgi:hypothetical protein